MRVGFTVLAAGCGVCLLWWLTRSAPGPASTHVTHPVTGQATELLPVATEWTAAPALEVASDTRPVVPPPARILLSGRVADPEGHAVSGQELRIAPGQRSWNDRARGGLGGFDFVRRESSEIHAVSDDEGRFQCEPSEGGAYEITTASDGWMVQPGLILEIVESREDVTVTVVRAPRVTVRVADAGFDGAAEANVHLQRVSPPAWEEPTTSRAHSEVTFDQHTDATGAAHFDAVPPGRYYATALSTDAMAAEVCVVEDRDVTLDIELAPRRATVLRVIDGSTSEPIADARVAVYCPTPVRIGSRTRPVDSPFKLETDRSGTVRLEHRSGLLHVDITAVGYGSWVGTLLDPEPEEITVVLHHATEPALQVVDRRSGRPIAGAEVEYVLTPKDRDVNATEEERAAWLRLKQTPPEWQVGRVLTDDLGRARIPYDKERHDTTVRVSAAAPGYAATSREIYLWPGNLDRTLRLGVPANLTFVLPDEFEPGDATRLVFGDLTNDHFTVRWSDSGPRLEHRGLPIGLPTLKARGRELYVEGLTAGVSPCYYFAESPALREGTVQLEPGENRVVLESLDERGVRFTVENWPLIEGYDLALTRTHDIYTPLSRMLAAGPGTTIRGPGPVELRCHRPGRYRVVAFPPLAEGEAPALELHATLTLDRPQILDLGSVRVPEL